MLPNRVVFGLPLCLFPDKVPWMISFSIQLCLMMCPKLRKFVVFIFANKVLVTPAFSRIHSLVFLAVHETRSICFNPFISKASIRDSSDFFDIQSSHPYIAADHALVFNNRTFVSIDMS